MVREWSDSTGREFNDTGSREFLPGMLLTVNASWKVTEQKNKQTVWTLSNILARDIIAGVCESKSKNGSWVVTKQNDKKVSWTLSNIRTKTGSWLVSNIKTKNGSWGIENQKDKSSIWNDLATGSNNIDWSVLIENYIDSGWDLGATFLFLDISSTWSLLEQKDKIVEYNVLVENILGSQDWSVSNQKDALVTWLLSNQEEVNLHWLISTLNQPKILDWGIVNSVSKDSSWNLDYTHLLQANAGWTVYQQAVSTETWNILAQKLKEEGWIVSNQKNGLTRWDIGPQISWSTALETFKAVASYDPETGSIYVFKAK